MAYTFKALKPTDAELESFQQAKTDREPCNPDAIAYCTKLFKLQAYVDEAKEHSFIPKSIIALMELHPVCGRKLRSYMPSAGGKGFAPRKMQEDKIKALLQLYGIPDELIDEAIAYHKPQPRNDD